MIRRMAARTKSMLTSVSVSMIYPRRRKEATRVGSAQDVRMRTREHSARPRSHRREAVPSSVVRETVRVIRDGREETYIIAEEHVDGGLLLQPQESPLGVRTDVTPAVA